MEVVALAVDEAELGLLVVVVDGTTDDDSPQTSQPKISDPRHEAGEDQVRQ
jgi:hypothetical protein